MYSYTICWYLTVAILVRPSTGLGLRKRRKPIAFSFSFSVHFFSSCRVLKRICVDIYSNDRQITWCEPKLKYHQHINFNLLRQPPHKLVLGSQKEMELISFLVGSLHGLTRCTRPVKLKDLIQRTIASCTPRSCNSRTSMLWSTK